MEPPALEDALLDVAERAGVEVRREPFDPGVFRDANKRGGLCWLRGTAVVLLDQGLNTVERVAVLAEALAALELDGLWMQPAVRERIELAARKRGRPRRRHLRRVV